MKTVADSKEWWEEVAQGLGVKAFDLQRQVDELRAERDLYRKKAHDWNAEADRYLAQRDELTVERDAVRQQLESLKAELKRRRYPGEACPYCSGWLTQKEPTP